MIDFNRPARSINLGVTPSKGEITWHDRVLAKVQRELRPEDAKKIVAISFNTEEYVVGESYGEVQDAFRRKFPDHAAFIVRADGSAVMRVPWTK
jgi:hypothetical protein